MKITFPQPVPHLHYHPKVTCLLTTETNFTLNKMVSYTPAFCSPVQIALCREAMPVTLCKRRASNQVCGESRRVQFQAQTKLKRRILTMSSDEKPDDTKSASSDADNDDDSENDRSSQMDNSRRPHDIPKSMIDWNQSWSDFQASGGRSMAPSGREPVSKEEVARQKIRNRFRSVSNSLPSRQKLFADWRFWIAIILALSLFTAFAQSSTPTPPMPTV